MKNVMIEHFGENACFLIEMLSEMGNIDPKETIKKVMAAGFHEQVKSFMEQNKNRMSKEDYGKMAGLLKEKVIGVLEELSLKESCNCPECQKKRQMAEAKETVSDMMFPGKGSEA